MTAASPPPIHMGELPLRITQENNGRLFLASTAMPYTTTSTKRSCFFIMRESSMDLDPQLPLIQGARYGETIHTPECVSPSSRDLPDS